MPKLVPSYNIYPGDYLAEAIAVCSLTTQAVWMRMEMVMTTCDRYGYLEHHRKPMPDLLVARRCGCTLEEYRAALQEMEGMGWLIRERKTLIICSEALIDQEAKREGTRTRVREHRKREITEGKATNYEGITNDLEIAQDSEFETTPVSNSLETNKVSNNEVTAVTRSCTGKGKGEGEGTVSVLAFVSPGTTPEVSRDHGDPVPEDPSPPPLPGDGRAYTPPTAADLLAQASEQARDFRTQGQAPAEAWDDSELFTEIALASPAALAAGWTALSLHGNSRVLSPVVDAVQLEAREQGLGQRNAALWLLARMREITGLVRAEAGWERYWTAGRMARFWQDTEYRNVAKFKAAQGGNNGNGNGSKRSKTDGNREAVRAALSIAGQQDGGDRRVPDGAGGGVGPNAHANGRSGVHRSDAGGEPGPVRRGVQSSVGDVPVLPDAGRAAVVRFPS